jgi:hypothetical protein
MKHAMQVPAERRKHKRFKVAGNAYAMVTPLAHRRSEILDISRGGLALSYVPQKDEPKIAIEVDPYLHIFLEDISFCLLRIPIQTVSDVEVKTEHIPSSVRRRSVKFGAMTQNQVGELEYFLQNHAMH